MAQILGGMFLFVILNNHLLMIDKKIIFKGNSTMTEEKARDRYQRELINIFENIEEAIITTKSGASDDLQQKQQVQF